MLMPRLRNRLFALAAFFGLLIGGGIAAAPAALADELNMDQSSAPAALASNDTIPCYQFMIYPAENPPVQSEPVPPVREESPAGPSVVPSFPSMEPSIPSEATLSLPGLVPPTSSTTTYPVPLVADQNETPQVPMNPAEDGASQLTLPVAGVTEEPHTPGSANPPLGARTATPAAPVLASTETPALARTGLSAQTVSLVAVLTAFAGILLMVLARRRQEN